VRNTDGKTALALAHHLHHRGVVKILSPVTTVKSTSFFSKKSRKNRSKLKRREIIHLTKSIKNDRGGIKTEDSIINTAGQ